MFEYLEAPSEALDCPICRSTLQDPVEITSCQHIFCSRCLAKWNYAACPIDRAKLDQAGVRRASVLVRSLLDDARVQCGECDWQGRREDWDSHACARAGSSKEIATEDNTSEAATCTYCHEAMSNQVEHYLQCEAIPTPCPHAIYGCPARLPRPQVAAHLPDCPFEKLKGVFAHFEDRFASLEDENRSLRAQVHSLADRLDLSESVTRNALGAFLDAPEDESLRNQMARLVEGITGLSHTIASLEMKFDMQVAAESLRLQEEIQVLRGHLHGVRMQVWQIMMHDNQRRDALSRGMPPVGEGPMMPLQSPTGSALMAGLTLPPLPFRRVSGEPKL